MASPMGAVGVQRKTIDDFIASIYDGRLQRELAQMQSLSVAVLLLEGRAEWTIDGYSLTGRSWTQAQHHGTIWSIQSRGIWVMQTSSLTETISVLALFSKWVAKEHHRNLLVRPREKPPAWGTPDSRAFALHLLQSFDGVGPELAGRIYDVFGIPLRWTVTADELQTVPGVGRATTTRLLKALEPKVPNAT